MCDIVYGQGQYKCGKQIANQSNCSAVDKYTYVICISTMW